MSFVRRVWNSNHQALLFNAGSMVGATAVNAALGFLYWWAAARLFPPAAVGLAAAAISAMTLLGTLGMLGFGTLLIGELPRHQHQKRPLITTALVIVGIVGGCFGALFALIAPQFWSEFQPISAHVNNMALFVLGVSLTSITLVLDQALLGLLRGNTQMLRNAVFAGTKLLALIAAGIWLSQKTGLSIYTTWLFGNLFSLLVLGGLAAYARLEIFPVRFEWNLARKLGRSALGHHALNLSLQLAYLLLPILVTVQLSAQLNASFYAAWMMTNFACAVPLGLSTMLYAVSDDDKAGLAHKTRFTLKLSLIADLAVYLVLLLGADYILRLFGPQYAVQAAPVLRVLGLGIFPIIIKDHYVAICRIEGRTTMTALRVVAATSLEIVLSAIGAYYGGLLGLSIGWVVAVYVQATFMAPTVYRTARATLHSTRRSGNDLAGESLLDVPASKNYSR